MRKGGYNVSTSTVFTFMILAVTLTIILIAFFFPGSLVSYIFDNLMGILGSSVDRGLDMLP